MHCKTLANMNLLLLPGASVGSMGINAQASQHLSWVGTCWDKETEV